ncbi:MAG: hypothetical protein WA152_02640 [Microgenomates group bacterium]
MSKLMTIAIKQQDSTDSFKTTRSFINSLEISSAAFLEKILGTKKRIVSFETLLIKNGIYNLITMSEDIHTHIESQLKFYFPGITIQNEDDPIQNLKMHVTEFVLESNPFNPLLTFENYPGIDSIFNSYKELLNNQSDSDLTLIQLTLSNKKEGWQDKVVNKIEKGNRKHTHHRSEYTDINLISDKLNYPCFDCSLRVASTTNKNQNIVNNLFNTTERQWSNKIVTSSKNLFLNNSIDNLLDRTNKKDSILNSSEITTLWHI